MSTKENEWILVENKKPAINKEVFVRVLVMDYLMYKNLELLVPNISLVFNPNGRDGGWFAMGTCKSCLYSNDTWKYSLTPFCWK